MTKIIQFKNKSEKIYPKTYKKILFIGEKRNETFDINDNISNYKYVEIFGFRGEGIQCYTKAKVIDNFVRVTLFSGLQYYGNGTWLDFVNIKIINNKVEFEQYASLYASISNNTTINLLKNNNIRISKIIGYK